MLDRAVIICRAFDLKLHSALIYFHWCFSMTLFSQVLQFIFTGVTVHPEEIVGLLVSSVMVNRTVIICRAFDLKLHFTLFYFHWCYNVSIITGVTIYLYFTGVTVHPEEIVGLLVNSGMFDRAVIICRAFDLKLHSVFENLALRYTCNFFILDLNIGIKVNHGPFHALIFTNT